MLIRGEKKLSVTWRLFWLLVALSHSRGHTYMTEAAMAKQLKTSTWQIQISLKTILVTGFFDPEKPKGIHRPNQYRRVYLPSETPEEFVRRTQVCPRIDVCVALHWIACDLAKDSGIAEFASRGLWPVSEEALRQARRKMERLGYFKVESSDERGRPAIYTRIDRQIADHRVEQDTRRPVGEDKPPQRNSWVEREPINISAATVSDEAERVRIAELQRKQRLALELGLDMPQGITARKIEANLPKKEVITPHKLYSGRVKDVEKE
jgi:hypothetical protein